MKKICIFIIFSIIISTLLYKTSLALMGNRENFTISENKYINIKDINKWNDKKWITLGDSITKAGGYQQILKNRLGFKSIDNMGINGQTMAYQNKKQSTYNLGKDIDFKKYDLVTIFIGTNDFRYEKKLGHIKDIGCNDLDEKTFCGSYQLLIEYILLSNPNIDLVLVTPIQRTKDGYDGQFTNKAGYKLVDYINSIKLLGEKYSLPVLDLYNISEIKEENIDIYTRDGLHPNDKGYEIIAKKIYKFLLDI